MGCGMSDNYKIHSRNIHLSSDEVKTTPKGVERQGNNDGPSNAENTEYKIIEQEFSCPLKMTLSSANILPDGRAIFADAKTGTITIYSEASSYYAFKFKANDIAVLTSEMIACVDGSNTITLFDVGQRRMDISHTFPSSIGNCYKIEWYRQFIVLISDDYESWTIGLFSKDGYQLTQVTLPVSGSAVNIPNISYSPLNRTVYVVDYFKGISASTQSTSDGMWSTTIANFKHVDIQHYSDIACDGSGYVYVLTHDEIGGKELYVFKDSKLMKINCRQERHSIDTYDRIQFVNDQTVFIVWNNGVRRPARVFQIKNLSN